MFLLKLPVNEINVPQLRRCIKAKLTNFGSKGKRKSFDKAEFKISIISFQTLAESLVYVFKYLCLLSECFLLF